MDLVRESFGITLVFALLWAALWFLRKKGWLQPGRSLRRPAGEQTIEVTDRIRLTPQHSVHVLRVLDRRLVVGVHASGFTLLCSLEAEAPGCEHLSSMRAKT